jgi:aminopeptidase N
MMDEWTKTKGFPILTVNLESQQEFSQTWKIEQKSCHSKDNEQLWKIPLATISTDGEIHEFMIEEKCQTIVVPISKTHDQEESKNGDNPNKEPLIKFNNNSTSFCLVKYNQEYLTSL